MSTFSSEPESLSLGALSVVLIGPDTEQRRAMAKALGPQASVAREFTTYPDADQLAEVQTGDYDVIIVHLDPNPESALDVVETLCGAGNNSVTVMIHAARPDPQLLLRGMRAGAREFLTDPLLPSVMGEALVRASARKDEVRRKMTPAGKLLVFTGAKGGVGVTTVASSFAVALAKYAKVALVDLGVELGDAAVHLGMTTKFSTLDALNSLSRLDSDFLKTLMTKHESGLSVLGGPDAIPAGRAAKDGIGRLLRAVREDFAYVVVDAGSHLFEQYDELFEAATTIYLVTQVGVPELRNANRFVTRYFSGAASEKLEVVLNRYLARNAEIDEPAVTQALTQPAKWKVPNDFPAARRAQNTGVALVLDKSQIANILKQMAMAACGEVDTPEKKKLFGLF